MSGLTDDLRALEEQLLRPDVRHQREQVAALLAEDFREFGSSGRVFSRQQILDALEEEASAELAMTDFATMEIAPGVVLATYHSSRVIGSEPEGSEQTEIRSLRSSIWTWRDGRWQMVFHQGTRVLTTGKG